MKRFLVVTTFLITIAGSTAIAAPRRRAATQPPLFPPCSIVTGTAAVTFTRDFGRSLAPSAQTLSGIAYTYGLAALDTPGVLLAWHRDDLLVSENHGCSWRVLSTIPGADFPPRLVAARGGRAYAWSENRRFLVRYDSRGPVRLDQPVEFLGFGADPYDGEHVRAGGIDGTIWESTDAGQSWVQIGGLRPEGSGSVLFYRFAFDPGDLDHIVAGVTGTGVYVTFDGGRSWRRSSGFGEGNVNAFNGVVSPVDGRVVWFMAINTTEADAGAPSHGRHIFRSTDGGLTFTAVVDESASVKLTNGPTMAADPIDPAVLFFVFGTRFQGYGTDLFRYDASTAALTQTHNDHHDVNAIAFSPADPRVMYLGLEVESGVR